MSVASSREPSAAVLAVIEEQWPQIVDDLAAVDAAARPKVARGHVDELAVRRARRASRRVLRPARFTPATWGGDAA